MISIDTNIVVRLIVEDDAEQVRRSRAAIKANGAIVGPSVLLEAAWVLGRSYKLTAATIATAFSVMAAAEEFRLPNWASALQDCVAAGVDISDAIHLFEASPDCAFATFDDKLVARSSRVFDRPEVISP
jgi:predicted nucleic-acid-binding protein